MPLNPDGSRREMTDEELATLTAELPGTWEADGRRFGVAPSALGGLIGWDLASNEFVNPARVIMRGHRVSETAPPAPPEPAGPALVP